ncbi:MAG: HAMP domain-containing sensor histidine kinase [Pontiella sp.]
MKPTLSIATSLRFWMIVVAIAPLLIMSFQGYHCARQAILQLKMSQLETISMAKQHRITDWLNERTRELHGHTAVSDGAACACRAQELLALNPAYESIRLYAHDWTLLSSFGSKPPHGPLPAAFRTRLKSNPSAISLPLLQEDGLIGLYIGVPTPANDQYIVATLDLSAPLDSMLAEPLGTDHAITSFLVLNDGSVLRSLATGMERQPSLTPRGSPTKGSLHPKVYRNISGEPVVGVAVWVEPLGGHLVSEASTHDAFAWVAILRTRAALTGLATLVLVVVLAGKIAHRLTRPLRHLAEVAHTVSEGHYTSRMQHFPGREHADVADAFNHMLDEIATAQQKLAHAAVLSAIGQLSASMVHEMRNPLSAIKMNLQVLQKHVENDPLHQELAEIASDQVRRLETMLTDLLQYGKKIELNIRAVNFEAFADDVLQCIRPPADHKHVSITFQNDRPNAPLYIDREQMLRALCNLADNAVHETPDGGGVQITLSGSATHPDEIILTVSDTGPGISDRIAEKLFDPFFTTKSKGVGLGLPNVKKIIELHGGTIAFQNQPDGGARFTIQLPTAGKQP